MTEEESEMLAENDEESDMSAAVFNVRLGVRECACVRACESERGERARERKDRDPRLVPPLDHYFFFSRHLLLFSFSDPLLL
jgi:hypothetical protein